RSDADTNFLEARCSARTVTPLRAANTCFAIGCPSTRDAQQKSCQCQKLDTRSAVMRAERCTPPTTRPGVLALCVSDSIAADVAEHRPNTEQHAAPPATPPVVPSPPHDRRHRLRRARTRPRADDCAICGSGRRRAPPAPPAFGRAARGRPLPHAAAPLAQR